MTQRTARRLCLVALAMTTGLTACSSSSGGSKSTGSAGTSSGSQGSGASGKPIRIMQEAGQTPSAAFNGISFPYGATGVKAAVAAINAAGGIDGHKLVADICDSHGDPNGSAQCGRTAVSNKDIAVVGTFDPIGAPQLLAVLEAAKIPYIGGLPTSVKEFQSPISFQFDGGPILSGSATSQLWADKGCKKVALILPANPGNDQQAALSKVEAKKLGVDVSYQLVKPGTADVAPSLSTALAPHPDCFTYSGDGQTNVKYISGLRHLQFKGKIITSTGSLTPPFLKALGPAGDGIIVLNSTLQPSSPDPMVKLFESQLSSYLHGDAKQIAINSNEFAQDGWSSVQLLKQALTGSKAVTSAALLAKIPTMCDVNVGNVYPHVDFCKPIGQSKTLPRVYNDYWQYFVAKGGEYVPTDNKWHDLRATMPS